MSQVYSKMGSDLLLVGEPEKIESHPEVNFPIYSEKPQLLKLSKCLMVEVASVGQLIQRTCATQSDQCPNGTFVVTRVGSKKLKVPEDWLIGVRERFNLLNSLTYDEKTFALEFEDPLSVACDIVCVLWSAFHSHFPNESFKSHRDDLVDSILSWVPWCGKDQRWIPAIKYQLAWLFASAEQQTEMPVKPTWLVQKDGHVLVGKLGRRFRNFRCGVKTLHIAWRNTILHGVKKGLPQMSPDSVISNLEKMKGRLTREVESDESLLEEIERTAREVIGKIRYEDIEDVNPWTSISANSCYENSRSKKGVLGYLTSDERWRGSVRSVFAFDRMACMSYCPRLNQTQTWYWPSFRFEDLLEEQRREALNCLDSLGSAEVHPILEPLKVRLISAGDVNSNGLWSSLQKILWGRLQRFPQFRLTGEWVKAEFLSELKESSDPSFDYWVSGDYSAATDSLNADATAAAYGAISGDPLILGILRKGLTNTQICFDKLRERGIKEGTALANAPDNFIMKSGQLMGSVFSFPLLCIINLAVFRAALEKRLCKTFKVSELPVLVNGDDILFRSDHYLYQIWCEEIAKVGFERSVGKNYMSPNFAVINSVYFADQKSIRAIPYFNMGWCTGVRKGGCGGMTERCESVDWDPFRLIQCMKDCEEWWSELRVGREEKINAILWSFKQEVLNWNLEWVQSSHLPLDCGPLGLRLREDDSSELHSDFRWHLLNLRKESATFGSPLCPKTMVPWKVVQVGCEPDPVLPGLVSTFWKFAKTQKYKNEEQKSIARFVNISKYSVSERRGYLSEFYREGTQFGMI